MTSFIADLLSNNFFEKCVNESLLSLNCILGSSIFSLSILVISFNFFAFYKLFKFFHKVNFETSLILFNIIQLIIIQLLIITCYAILIECFIVVQIGMLTWIIRKFNILLKNPIKFFKKNKLFLFLNILNISLIIYYIALLFIKDSVNFNYPIILFHTFFSLFCSLILVIYSCSLINKIKKINKSEKESPQKIIAPSDQVNNALLVNKDNNESNKSKELIFYSKRERQIKPLFKINFICTFLEFSFVLSIRFIPNINFEKDIYKIIPESVMSHIFYYLFIFVCIMNTFTNFFCFFWGIKKQYKISLEVKKVIMTHNNLKQQKKEIGNNMDAPNLIEENIEDSVDKSYNNNYDNNDFNSSFEDLFVENQNICKNTEEDFKSSDIFNDDSFGKIDKENNESLNNEIKNRQSIDLFFNSQNGINRISQNTMSNLKEEN